MHCPTEIRLDSYDVKGAGLCDGEEGVEILAKYFRGFELCRFVI